jgi:hypothetical protein
MPENKRLSQSLLGYAEALMNFVQRCLAPSIENVFWSRDVRNVNWFRRTLLIHRLCRIICHPVRIFYKTAHGISYYVYTVVMRCNFWMGENATHNVTFGQHPSRMCQRPVNVGDRATRPSVTYTYRQFAVVLLSSDSWLVLHDAILIPTTTKYLRQEATWLRKCCLKPRWIAIRGFVLILFIVTKIKNREYITFIPMS